PVRVRPPAPRLAAGRVRFMKKGGLLEQAVIVHLWLRDGGFGSPDERKAIEALEDQIELAIDEASAGEFDGNEFGGGECVLFLHALRRRPPLRRDRAPSQGRTCCNRICDQAVW